jgi:hypothetical protein
MEKYTYLQMERIIYLSSMERIIYLSSMERIIYLSSNEMDSMGMNYTYCLRLRHRSNIHSYMNMTTICEYIWK